ncbi:MAG: hypothetical protein LRZ93_04370 [Clostridiales bacterium]|nr:hypothetical protein [Clostridiales bacterium]
MSFTIINEVALAAIAEIADTLIPVVLGGVFVYEVFGPVIAKIALDRAGEIDIKRTAK